MTHVVWLLDVLLGFGLCVNVVVYGLRLLSYKAPIKVWQFSLLFALVMSLGVVACRLFVGLSQEIIIFSGVRDYFMVSASVALWSISPYLRVERYFDFTSIYGLACLILVILGGLIAGEPKVTSVSPLNNILFALHIIAILLAFSHSAIAMLSLVFYGLLQKSLKSKLRISSLHVLSLDSLDRMSLKAIVVATGSLAVGLVLGIYLAHVFWSTNWIKEEKVWFSFLTLVNYLVVLIGRYVWGWRGRKFLLAIGVGLLSISAIFTASLLWTHS